MKIRDGIKLGIGLMVGECIFYAFVCIFERWMANDDKYMNGLKDRRPDLYEKLLKYRTK